MITEINYESSRSATIKESVYLDRRGIARRAIGYTERLRAGLFSRQSWFAPRPFCILHEDTFGRKTKIITNSSLAHRSVQNAIKEGRMTSLFLGLLHSG